MSISSTRAPERAALACALCAWLSACDPNLPPRAPSNITVEIIFTEFHTDVEARWQGELLSIEYAPTVQGASETVAPIEAFFSDVAPGNAGKVELPRAANVQPGLWRIVVEASENVGATGSGTEIFRVVCRDVDIGDNAVDIFEGDYVLRVIEDGTCQSGIGSIPPLPPRPRDAEAVSITISSTDPVAAGTSVPVIVQARNNGEFQEIVEVSVAVTAAAGGASVWSDSETVAINAGAVRPVAFTWDTSCLPADRYAATATVTAAEDDAAANNVISSSVSLTAARRLDVAFADDNPTALTRGQLSLIRGTVTVGNGNSGGETNVQVAFTDTGTSAGNFSWARGPQFSLVPCGQSVDVDVIYQPGTVPSGTSENHTFRLDILSPGAPGATSDQMNVTISAP